MPKRRIAMFLVVLAAGLLATAGAAAAAPSSGRHLYGIGHVGSASELLPFDIAIDGSLAEREDQAFPLPDGTDGVIAVGRDARTVYVGSADSVDPLTADPVPGMVEVLHVADDGSLSLLQTVGANPAAIAIAPDGSRLFTTATGNAIVSFPIESDGTLGAEHAPTVVPGSDLLTLTLSADGAALYAGTYDETVLTYGIDGDGTPTPAPGSVSLPCQGTFSATAPGGGALDVLCDGSLDAYGYAIGPDDRLADTPAAITAAPGLAFALGSLIASGPGAGMAADPSGSTLALATSGLLALYAIAPDGSLAATPSSTLVTWADSVAHLVYAPDRSPVAAVLAGTSALTATFDARSSSAVDGEIARYSWDFGDGSALADGGPTPSHRYAAPGDYHATVTVADSAGCSVTPTYSGAGSLCAGSPAARATVLVHVVAAPVAPADPGTPGVPSTLPAEPAAPAPAATSTGAAGGSAPAASTRPLVLDRLGLHLRSARLTLSWRASGGVAPRRYLVVWSVRAHGRRVEHRAWTTATSLRLPRSTPHTLRVVLSAYGASGTLLGRVGRTVSLTR